MEEATRPQLREDCSNWTYSTMDLRPSEEAPVDEQVKYLRRSETYRNNAVYKLQAAVNSLQNKLYTIYLCIILLCVAIVVAVRAH